jgi:proteic killer suppression protein
MIKSFRSKGLKELFEDGSTAAINEKYHDRCIKRLDLINAATNLRQLDLPGWNMHPLKGKQAGRHSIAVSGPWRITFEFRGEDAYLVDFEQYH